ncbi:hypothetical protein ACGC1H_004763 [Rhizoctonia solani]|uniref:Uncharacterized protein n=1 Tax=Rhizoctonia solani TaxID=456999 RepID=A0A8H2XG28_9AGAM|nr:unnamed protein product [Rhizoctonia solani]
MSSSMSNTTSYLGVLSASDTEPEMNLSSGSQSDTDFEVVLITRATTGLAISDSDSASLVSIPTDLSESSDDEHIFVQNIAQSAPNTPRPPPFIPPRLDATPRPRAAIPRPIFEEGHDSEASDREDDSSAGSLYDSDSDADGSVVARARARTLANTHGRLEAPVALHSTASLDTVHGNASTATIRPARPTSTNTLRRSTPAGMHTPAITTNTIAGIVASAPLSPPTPSDDGEIPYVPFTAAPTAVMVPVPAVFPVTSALRPPTFTPAPPIPTAQNITRKMWCAMNRTRIKLGFRPLQHSLREQLNSGQAAKEQVASATESSTTNAALQPKPKSKSKKSKAKSKAKVRAVANPLVAPPPTAGRSPVSSEDEAPRQRASMFLPVNDMSMRSDSPDEEAYDEAIRQLDEHMTSPPEHPTAAYRFLLNRALLLEFRVCTPETLPTSHGAAIAMVKANVHINVLDYVAKRKQGFGGLRSVMLASAKALRKDVKKRRMPAKTVKSLGLHSLLIHH